MNGTYIACMPGSESVAGSRIIFVAAVAFFCAAVAAAGTNRWTQTGPRNGDGTEVVLVAFALDSYDSRIVYVVSHQREVRDGADTTFWRSTDGGTTWERGAQFAVGLYSTLNIAVSRANPQEIYILTTDAVLYSPSGGATWTRRTLPSSYRNNVDLFVDGTRSSALYVLQLASCGFFSCESPSGGGVFRSRDSGREWRLLGMNEIRLDGLFAEPTDPVTIYVTDVAGKLFQTRDAGGRWNISGPAGVPVRRVAVDPIVPSTVYVTPRSGGVIYKSVDYGLAWRSIDPGGWSSVNDIVVFPRHSLNLLASVGTQGVFLSSDGGETWTSMNAGLEGRSPPALLVARDETVYYALTRESLTRGSLYKYSPHFPRRRAVRR